MGEEINFYFRKEKYGWLSNFWRCWQVVDDVYYPTNEHYYQSQKAKEGKVRVWIGNAPSPYLAMIAGRALRERKELVDDWDLKKVEIMLKGLRAKFKNPELRKKLIETGNAVLHENSPTDMFWGKKGKGMLGKLLMQVRDEIKKEEKEKMDIGEHEEYPKGDVVLLCDVEGCNRRAIGRIGNKRLCDLHLAEMKCLYCGRKIPTKTFINNGGLCDLCKGEADRREKSRHDLIY